MAVRKANKKKAASKKATSKKKAVMPNSVGPRILSALTDVRLENRGNYMYAVNNGSRDIELTYRVRGRPSGPYVTDKLIRAGRSVRLGIINAGGGQVFSYRKMSARYAS